MGYCSDTWHIAHPVHLVGHGWGLDDVINADRLYLTDGIRFAPLCAGIILDNASTEDQGSGMAAEGSHLRDVVITSTQAVVLDPIGNGSGGNGKDLFALDVYYDVRVSGAYYEKGTCVLADGSSVTHGLAPFCEGATRDPDSPVVMFRVTTAGWTPPASVTPAAFASAGLTNLGEIIEDGDELRWTVESIPKDYKNNEPYIVGQRVFLPGDPSCVFRCNRAGTSQLLTTLRVGIGVSCPYPMIAPSYKGKFYDNANAYGDLFGTDVHDVPRWEVEMPSGIVVLASNCMFDHVGIAGFTGAASYATDNIDGPTFDTPNGEANFTFYRNACDATYCGGGIKFFGGNTNGGQTDNLFVYFLGLGRTDVDQPAYLNIVAVVDGEDVVVPTFGTGAYAVWDASLGGGMHSSIYGQAFAGCPFRNDRTDQAGSASVWVKCTAEVGRRVGQEPVPRPYPSHFTNSPVLIEVRPDTRAGGGGIFLGAGCRGLHGTNREFSSPLQVTLDGGGYGILDLQSKEDGPYAIAWGYGSPIGHWSLRYGYNNVFWIAGQAAGINPGLGHMTFPRGHLIGDAVGTRMFRGAAEWAGFPTGFLYDRGLRGGLRNPGDEFATPTGAITIVGEGYRGEVWQPNAPVTVADEAVGNPAYLVEPTTNGAFPPSGLSVFKCTVGVTTGAEEPRMVTTRWSAGATINLNDAIVPSHAKWNGFWFKATSVVGAQQTDPVDEPDWDTTVGSPTTDGDIIWTCQGPAWGLEAGEDTRDNGVVWTWAGTTPAMIITRGPGGGQTTIAMGDANQTLDDAQAAATTIKATTIGALTADRDLRFPAPKTDAEAYQRTIRAALTGGNLLVDIVGGAAPIRVAAGKTAIIGFDATGVYRVTADT
jgi:hypothetical protein